MATEKTSIHDLLSLGEIELGLSATHRGVEEIQRLPLLLRILSKTRPLSSIECFSQALLSGANASASASASDDNSSSHHHQQSNNGNNDDLVNDVVSKLEDVAAMHSVAEGVDVVTCHLAPTVCRKISKLSPLKKIKQQLMWDTTELASVAKNPSSATRRSNKRRRYPTDDPGGHGQHHHEDDGIMGGESDEDEDDMEGEAENSNDKNSNNNNKRKRSNSERESIGGDAEDTQEATFTKTLSELASLVVTSLEPIANEQQEEVEGSTVTTTNKGKFSLTIDDSILSESGQRSDEGVDGAMARSDLGSTLAAIMHHAPVLQSRHVACALCRASIPSAGELLMRMGANCPSAVPCILRGCIDAYTLAIEHGNFTIANVSKKSVQSLSTLSQREKCRIRSVLFADGIMSDLQFELAMEQDPNAACSLLLQNLSYSTRNNNNNRNNNNFASGNRQALEMSEQTPGDKSSSDFRDHDRDTSAGQGLYRTIDRTLLEVLRDSPSLVKRTLSFYALQLKDRSSKKCTKWPIGKLCLFMSSYSWLLLCGFPLNAQDVLVALQDMKHELERKSNDFKNQYIKENNDPTIQSSKADRAFMLLQCALILTLSRIYALLPTNETTSIGRNNFRDQIVTFINSVSCDADYFIHKIINSLKYKDHEGIFCEIISNLATGKSHSNEICSHDIRTGLKLLCDANCNDTDSSATAAASDTESESSKDLHEVRLNALLMSIQQDDQATLDKYESLLTDAKTTLQSILNDPNLNAKKLIHNESFCKAISKATVLIAQKLQPAIPIVLPLHIEEFAMKLDLNKLTSIDDFHDENCFNVFLLQLLHSLEFLDQVPMSPFALNLRSLPIKVISLLCETLMGHDEATYLTGRIVDLMNKHCPELQGQFKCWQLQKDATRHKVKQYQHLTRNQVLNVLLSKLKTCLASSNPDEPSTALEELYFTSRARIPDVVLYPAVVSALISKPNEMSEFLTYSHVCKDPLILMKCPIKAWTCCNIRRIILSILTSILETNAAMIVQTSPSSDAAVELLASRNALLMRCILVATSGAEPGVDWFYCSMTISFLRTLVAEYRGVVAILIKQGLPEVALDWLVEFVPETMDDSFALLPIFGDRSSLTPAERLVAADAVIRIAITHGHRNEDEAVTLVSVALAQLVNFFFLVIGPVGVPVNALLGDGTGPDVTQISRSAAFRILKALLKVRGRRVRFRNECSIALQKLATICKGESLVVGLGGAVAVRRKSLLKEIFDAVMKAVNSMGSAIGSQTPAA